MRSVCPSPSWTPPVCCVDSRSADQTQHIGELLGAQLEGGDVVGLRGELGVGKTCLAQGIARGLGVDPAVPVTSPTFVLVAEYPARVALRHVGVGQEEVGWITILAAFAFVRLISALPITPGGVGVVELGYVAVLTKDLPEELRAQVVAAVLVFRFLTFFLPIPTGALSYSYWRANTSWRQAPEDDA